jgi:hypothetical protein
VKDIREHAAKVRVVIDDQDDMGLHGITTRRLPRKIRASFRPRPKFSGGDFRTLNVCLNVAIAEAVTEFSRQRERAIAMEGTERLGVFAHELRNLLNTALLSFESIKCGRVAPGGSTGIVHARSLMSLRNLAERSLAEVRLDAGTSTARQKFGRVMSDPLSTLA